MFAVGRCFGNTNQLVCCHVRGSWTWLALAATRNLATEPDWHTFAYSVGIGPSFAGVHACVQLQGDIVQAAAGTKPRKAGSYANRDPTLNWDDIAWFQKHTKMKIVVKGVQTGEDAVTVGSRIHTHTRTHARTHTHTHTHMQLVSIDTVFNGH